MLLVHILSDQPTGQNTQAFLLPVLSNKSALAERNVAIRCFYAVEPTIFDCDVLAVSNKTWTGSFEELRTETIDRFAEFSERIPTVLFFDRSSTPAHVVPEVFPYVTKYYKNALFRDRTTYFEPLRRTRLCRLLSSTIWN